MKGDYEITHTVYGPKASAVLTTGIVVSAWGGTEEEARYNLLVELRQMVRSAEETIKSIYEEIDTPEGQSFASVKCDVTDSQDQG